MTVILCYDIALVKVKAIAITFFLQYITVIEQGEVKQINYNDWNTVSGDN